MTLPRGLAGLNSTASIASTNRRLPRGVATEPPRSGCVLRRSCDVATGKEATMDSIIYLVGLNVIVIFLLSALGLR
jgi:hypothetical protein